MKILIAEDTRDLNRALQAILERNGYQVTCTFDGQDALDHAMSESFDAIILDVMMPIMDGIESLRQMRERGVTTPVLILSAKSQVDDRVAGLDAGADDYLPKPFAMKELLARVRAMCKRHSDYSDGLLCMGDITLRADTFELSSENTVRLSVKELELMQLLVKNADRPLTPAFIMEHVWYDDPTASEETLVLYLSYLRAKLRSVGSSIDVKVNAEGKVVLDGVAPASEKSA